MNPGHSLKDWMDNYHTVNVSNCSHCGNPWAFDLPEKIVCTTCWGYFDKPKEDHWPMPEIQLDGNQWCALYGEDLHTGLAAFGDHKGEALKNFVTAWKGERDV